MYFLEFYFSYYRYLNKSQQVSMWSFNKPIMNEPFYMCEEIIKVVLRWPNTVFDTCVSFTFFSKALEYLKCPLLKFNFFQVHHFPWKIDVTVFFWTNESKQNMGPLRFLPGLLKISYFLSLENHVKKVSFKQWLQKATYW